MANQTLLSAISLDTIPKSWAGECIAQLNSSAYDWSHGLVNSHGRPVSELTNATWGITIETCEMFCNHVKIPFVGLFLLLSTT